MANILSCASLVCRQDNSGGLPGFTAREKSLYDAAGPEVKGRNYTKGRVWIQIIIVPLSPRITSTIWYDDLILLKNQNKLLIPPLIFSLFFRSPLARTDLQGGLAWARKFLESGWVIQSLRGTDKNRWVFFLRERIAGMERVSAACYCSWS